MSFSVSNNQPIAFDATVDRITHNGDGTSIVTRSGTEYTVSTNQLRSGTACILVPSSTLGTGSGPYTKDTDGIAVTALKPKPARLRAELIVTHTDPLLGDLVYFNVIGLSVDERAYFSFTWDFDDTGDFQFLGSDYPLSKSKNVRYGYTQAHAWGSAGSKTVTVTVGRILDDGTSDTFTLSTTITVRDPDTVFASNTWVVGVEEGDTPPSGTQVTDLQAALTAVVASGVGGRILLKGGATFAMSEIRGFPNGVECYLASWGPGRATISEADFNLVNATPSALVVNGIAFTGDYDPATGLGADTTKIAWRVRSTARLSIFDCTFSGVLNAVEVWGNEATNNSRIGLFDFAISDWENFGIYTSVTWHFAMVGYAIQQSQTATNGDDARNYGAVRNYPVHGPVRLSNCHGPTICSNGRAFSNTGWTGHSDPGAPAGKVALMYHQPIIRLGSSRLENTCCTLIDGNFFEGGSFSLGPTATNGVSCRADAIIVSNNYHLMSANPNSSMEFGHTNTRVVNNIVVTPNVLDESANRSRPVGVFRAQGPTDGLLDGDIKTDFNTFVFLRSDANFRALNKSVDRVITMDSQGISYTEAQNIVHMPNITLSDEAGPRDADGPHDTTTIGVTPRYLGQRRANIDDSPATTDTTYATPAADAVTGRMQATSPAIGAVSVGVARPAHDFTRTARTGATSRGAYHAAS